jgi:hypothetical protein
MVTPRKKAAVPEAPIGPHIGDKVTTPRSKSVLEINHVHFGGHEVDLQLPGSNLQWFRVKTDTLTYADRKAPARTATHLPVPNRSSTAASCWTA